MKYEVTEPGPNRVEMWDQKTVKVHSGGFNINPNDFPRGEGYAKKGLLLNVNFATRSAKPVKTVVLAAAATDAATDLVVAKNHILVVGDIIGNGTKSAAITAITPGQTTDTITIDAALGALAKDTVLQSSVEAGDNKALLAATKINYADVKLEGQPSVTAIYAADEVRESKLPYAITEAAKESLTVRFLFIP